MAKQPLVIGLDLGTTACKAVALDRAGAVAATADGAYPTHTPQSGWVEQNVDEVWTGAAAALRSLTSQLVDRKIDAIAFSGAMHSVAPVMRDGTALARAMTWADGRAKEAGLSSKIERTGCPPRAVYHPARLRWWFDEAPDIAEKAELFAAIKDVMIFRLTGEWVTDQGLASTTGLLDLRRLDWDDEALTSAGVTRKKLPGVAKPQACIGNVTAEAARATGLPEGLPVIAGGSDGGLANLGAGATRPGQAVVTVGTSGAVRLIVDSPRPDVSGGGRTWCYYLADGRYFIGGAINNGGLALQWVRERFFADAAFERMMEEALAVPVGADGVMLLPYLTGERSPHWRSDARATLAGLGLHHTRGHVARAALEGVAFCLRDVWEIVASHRAADEPVRLTGGITKSPGWCRIVADVLGVPLRPVDRADASAIGAAMMGWWGIGGVPSLDALAVEVPTTITPDRARHEAYRALHARWRDAGLTLIFR